MMRGPNQSTMRDTRARSSRAVSKGEVRRPGAAARSGAEPCWTGRLPGLLASVCWVFKFGVMAILGAVIAPISGIATLTRQTQSARWL